MEQNFKNIVDVRSPVFKTGNRHDTEYRMLLIKPACKIYLLNLSQLVKYIY